MKSIVITPDGSVSLENLDGWKGIKRAIGGGYLEALAVGHDFTAYIDEDGKAKELEQNLVATKVVCTMLSKVGRVMFPGDFISGTLVIVGVRPSEDPEEGLLECDVPEHVTTTYFPKLRTSP
jgi:hypothetical protein